MQLGFYFDQTRCTGCHTCVVACKDKALTFGDPEDPRSDVRMILDINLSLRRRPELGTGPQVYYIL